MKCQGRTTQPYSFSHYLEYCHTGIEERTVDNGTLFDCFVLSEEPMTFKDAVVYCGNQGIPLAEIQTELDHSNIIEKLQVCCNNWKIFYDLPKSLSARL